MRKLTTRERLENWRNCDSVSGWECDQCPHYEKFTSIDEQRAHDTGDPGGLPDGWCGLAGSWGRPDGHATYSDECCFDRFCESCDGNERCALQAHAARFVDDLDLLWADAELEDIPLFQSLMLNEVLRTIAKRCPHFKPKAKP